MCGLTAYVGTEPANKYVIKAFFAGNSTRGGHSCGISNVKFTLKDTVDVYNILQNDDIEAVVSGNNIIMHNRFATTGAKTVENAHPFLYRNNGILLGAMNGWLKYWKQTYLSIVLDDESLQYIKEDEADKKAKENGITFPEVDSEVVFMTLNFLNKDKKLGDYDFSSLTKWHGAFNIIIHSIDCMVVYKRSNKPLCYVEDNGVYISSLDTIPSALYGKKNVKYFKEDTVTIFNNDNDELVRTVIDIQKPDIIVSGDDALPKDFILPAGSKLKDCDVAVPSYQKTMFPSKWDTYDYHTASYSKKVDYENIDLYELTDVELAKRLLALKKEKPSFVYYIERTLSELLQ